MRYCGHCQHRPNCAVGPNQDWNLHPVGSCISLLKLSADEWNCLTVKFDGDGTARQLATFARTIAIWKLQFETQYKIKIHSTSNAPSRISHFLFFGISGNFLRLRSTCCGMNGNEFVRSNCVAVPIAGCNDVVRSPSPISSSSSLLLTLPSLMFNVRFFDGRVPPTCVFELGGSS